MSQASTLPDRPLTPFVFADTPHKYARTLTGLSPRHREAVLIDKIDAPFIPAGNKPRFSDAASEQSVVLSATLSPQSSASTAQAKARKNNWTSALGKPFAGTNIGRIFIRDGFREASVNALRSAWFGADALLTPFTSSKVRPYAVGITVAVIAGVAIGLTHGAAGAVFGALLLGAVAGGITALYNGVHAPGITPRDTSNVAATGGRRYESRWDNDGMLQHAETSYTANPVHGDGVYQSWRRGK